VVLKKYLRAAMNNIVLLPCAYTAVMAIINDSDRSSRSSRGENGQNNSHVIWGKHFFPPRSVGRVGTYAQLIIRCNLYLYLSKYYIYIYMAGPWKAFVYKLYYIGTTKRHRNDYLWHICAPLPLVIDLHQSRMRTNKRPKAVVFLFLR